MLARAVLDAEEVTKSAAKQFSSCVQASLAPAEPSPALRTASAVVGKMPPFLEPTKLGNTSDDAATGSESGAKAETETPIKQAACEDGRDFRGHTAASGGATLKPLVQSESFATVHDVADGACIGGYPIESDVRALQTAQASLRRLEVFLSSVPGPRPNFVDASPIHRQAAAAVAALDTEAAAAAQTPGILEEALVEAATHDLELSLQVAAAAANMQVHGGGDKVGSSTLVSRGLQHLPRCEEVDEAPAAEPEPHSAAAVFPAPQQQQQQQHRELVAGADGSERGSQQAPRVKQPEQQLAQPPSQDALWRASAVLPCTSEQATRQWLVRQDDDVCPTMFEPMSPLQAALGSDALFQEAADASSADGQEQTDAAGEEVQAEMLDSFLKDDSRRLVKGELEKLKEWYRSLE